MSAARYGFFYPASDLLPLTSHPASNLSRPASAFSREEFDDNAVLPGQMEMTFSMV
jgi:hypothetical protein